MGFGNFIKKIKNTGKSVTNTVTDVAKKAADEALAAAKAAEEAAVKAKAAAEAAEKAAKDIEKKVIEIIGDLRPEFCSWEDSTCTSSVFSPRWMTDLNLGEMKLKNLCVPGAHDAGTFDVKTQFSPGKSELPELLEKILRINNGNDFAEFVAKAFNVNGTKSDALKFVLNKIPAEKITHYINKGIRLFSRTQNCDFYTQLNIGSRFLDLRLCKYENEYYFHHTLLAGKLTEGLDQIARYASEQSDSEEIIYLAFSHFKGMTNDDTAYQNIIAEKLGHFFYDHGNFMFSEFLNLTLNDITRNGLRIIPLVENTINPIYVNKMFNTGITSLYDETKHNNVENMRNYQQEQLDIIDFQTLSNLLEPQWVLTLSKDDYTFGVIIAALKHLLGITLFNKLIDSNLRYNESLELYANEANKQQPQFVKANADKRMNVFLLDFVSSETIAPVIEHNELALTTAL